MKNTNCVCYIEGTNYDLSGIKVTFKSLREHYNDLITVLYKSVDEKLLTFLRSQNVNCIDCSEYKVTFNTSPYNNKVIYSYLFLRKNKDVLQNHTILLCDISDIYFKCNPFDLFTGQFTLFLEDKNFRHCDCNSTWINICYGPVVLNSMLDKIVVNAGIYLSNYFELLEFMQLMVKEMSVILGKINYPIVEQAIVNKLVYFDNAKCFLDSCNVNNMAQQIKTSTDNNINHQYKVFPSIKDELYLKYDT